MANSILTFSGRDPRASFADEIRNDRYVLLLRVTDIDDDFNDDCVRVALFIGEPDFSNDCSSTLPGRAYAIRRDYIAPGGTGPDAPLFAFDGEIHSGRLIVNRGGLASALVALPFDPLLEQPLPLVVRGFQLRADLRADALDHATLGGFVYGNEILDPLRTAISASWSGDPSDFPYRFWESLLDGYVDVQLQGVCVLASGDQRTFGGISLGFGLHAVRATISDATPIADAPLPGRCGSSTAMDGGAGDP